MTARSERTFTSAFLFCGLGAGARGFLEARSHLGAAGARFVNLGGVDNDPEACTDFESLTSGRALCADLSATTPEQLRAFLGDETPDCIFASPPCKGLSGLLSKAQAATEKYQALNRLVVQGLHLAVETWATPPGLIVLENVPRITSRGAKLLLQVRQLLGAYGYLFHEATHDCGELGGLAQHRRRYLLVARLPAKVSAYVYRPPLKRVRACGEVLGELLMPEDSAAGPLHRLPRLSWLNWVRLALIPAGGDWRDLPGMAPPAGAARPLELATPLAPGQERRAIWARHDVRSWLQPARTVAGSGSNGGVAVADPRVEQLHLDHAPRRGTFGVTSWAEPAAAVRGRADVRTGEAAVADRRVADAVKLGRTARGAGTFKGRPGLFGVGDWNQPAPTVTGNAKVSGGNATAAIADPRPRFGNWDRVTAWTAPTGRVTSAGRPAAGGASVADPRLATSHRAGRHTSQYRVRDWNTPAGTVTGDTDVQEGAQLVADPRLTCAPRAGAYGVGAWSEPAATVIGSACVDNSRSAIADPRPAPARYLVLTLAQALEMLARGEQPGEGEIPVIVAADGTWHRPLTTLELGALQGLPAQLNGAPLQLAGRRVSAWRERIGNAVPRQAATAIAETLLTALLASALGTWALGSTGIWVQRDEVELLEASA